jgi:hypothetical protein
MPMHTPCFIKLAPIRSFLFCICITLGWVNGTAAREGPVTEILEDDLSIRLRNTKAQFLAVFVERRQVIRFETHEDLVKHSRFILPESLDPPYDRSFVPWAQRDGPARPRWVNVRMEDFSAHVLHADGTRGELPVIVSTENRDLRNLRTIDQMVDLIHDVQGLEVGDVLEVRWKYMIPWDDSYPRLPGWGGMRWVDNWARLTSWRIFMHGELPVRQQRIELVYDRRHGLIAGGAEPSERIEGRNEIILRWINKDLPGCMAEPNSLPAQDLPHITVLLAVEDPRYMLRDRYGGFPHQQPHWLQVIRQREAKAFWWRRVARERIPNRQSQLMRDVIHRVAGHLPDSAKLARLEAVHEHIAWNFDYEHDDLWYRDVDNSNERIGDQMDQQRIRDISRYNMYSKLINLLNLDYGTAYLMDRRAGMMNDRYMSPVWDSEFLIRVDDGNDRLWMHPKRSQSGLMANEFPFYWQGTPALVADLWMMMDDLPSPPLFTELPGSDPMENVRGTGYELEVSLKDRMIHSDARIFLSGQYSTLGRASYLGFPIDSTVDPLYGRRVFDLPGSKLNAWTNEKMEFDRPFRFQGRGRMVLSNELIVGDDGATTINLTPLIAHVLPASIDAGKRALPFHWDFPNTDRYRIELKFDEPIEVHDADGLDLELSTSGSSFERRIQVLSPYHVVVETRFEVKRTWEYNAELEKLAELIRRAQEEIVLRVRVLNDAEGYLRDQ